MDVSVAEAEAVGVLESLPVEANAAEGFVHVVVVACGRLRGRPKLIGKGSHRGRVLEGLRDGRARVEDALVRLVARVGSNDAVHGVHVVAQAVRGVLHLLVPHLRVFPAAHHGVSGLLLNQSFLEGDAEDAGPHLGDCGVRGGV